MIISFFNLTSFWRLHLSRRTMSCSYGNLFHMMTQMICCSHLLNLSEVRKWTNYKLPLNIPFWTPSMDQRSLCKRSVPVLNSGQSLTCLCLLSLQFGLHSPVCIWAHHYGFGWGDMWSNYSSVKWQDTGLPLGNSPRQPTVSDSGWNWNVVLEFWKHSGRSVYGQRGNSLSHRVMIWVAHCDASGMLSVGTSYGCHW